MRPNLLGTEIKVNNIRSEMILAINGLIFSTNKFYFLIAISISWIQKKKKKKKKINSKPHPCLVYHHFVKEIAITKEESENGIFMNIFIP